MLETRTTGLVLARTSFGEADRILRIFTNELGLVSAIAKGVRKTKARLAGALELFSFVDLRLHRRSGELFLVVGAHPTPRIGPIPRVELARLATIYTAAEWLLALLPPEKPHPKVFNLTQEFFTLLGSTTKPDLLLIAWKARLLNLLGYLPEFSDPTRAQKVIRFTLAGDLAHSLRLESDAELFLNSAQILDSLFESAVGRPAKVPAAVSKWR